MYLSLTSFNIFIYNIINAKMQTKENGVCEKGERVRGK